MELFTSKEKEIINLLISKDKTLSEISKHLQISKPATSKYLKKFEQQGLITSTYQRTKNGRTIRYHLRSFHLICSIDSETKTITYATANQRFNPQYPYLGMIPQRSFRQEIKTYLSSLSIDQFDSLFILLFGSVAKGKGQRKSDIDLLFIKDCWNKKEKEKMYEDLAEASPHCHHQAKPLFKTKNEVETLNTDFKKELYDHGIILLSKGNKWSKIIQKMKRYKNIPN